MSDGYIGLLLLTLITGFTSLMVHRKTIHFVFGCIVSAALSVSVFQLIAYVHLGHIDPFILIALPMSLLLSLGISVFMGKVVQSQRRRREGQMGKKKKGPGPN